VSSRVECLANTVKFVDGAINDSVSRNYRTRVSSSQEQFHQIYVKCYELMGLAPYIMKLLNLLFNFSVP
jgi:hypothetical protein